MYKRQDVKIAIMKFSTDVEWVTPEPVKIEEYQYWNRLEADGLTFMGDAFLELSKKLSRSTFLSSPSLSFAPVIFLLSDGSPNDDWKKGLDTLKQNKCCLLYTSMYSDYIPRTLDEWIDYYSLGEDRRK